MPSELVTGLEYNHNYLHDVTVGYNHDIAQRVNIYSAYAQNEWRDNRWGFLVGARIDKHSMIHNPIVSPRVNIRFNPSEKANFRLSYSTGFRSPQAYDEDFHIAIVGGDRVVTVLAPGLKQESSNSISGSADFYHRFGTVQANLMVEGFFTDLRDVFAIRQLDHTDAAGNAVQERYNASFRSCSFYFFPIAIYRTGGRLQQTGNYIQKRGFPAAGRTNHTDKFIFMNVKVHTV